MDVGWQVYLDILITSDSSIVLLRREDESLWCLPGGWLVRAVAPTRVVAEFAQEQVGLSIEEVNLVWAEVRQGEKAVLVLHYQAEAPDYPSPGEGIAEARLFQVEHLPPLSDADREALFITLTGGDSFFA